MLSKATTGALQGGTSPACATTVFVAGSIRVRPVPVWLVTHRASSATADQAARGTGIRATAELRAHHRRGVVERDAGEWPRPAATSDEPGESAKSGRRRPPRDPPVPASGSPRGAIRPADGRSGQG